MATPLEDRLPCAVRDIHPAVPATAASVQRFGSEIVDLTYKTPVGPVPNELRSAWTLSTVARKGAILDRSSTTTRTGQDLGIVSKSRPGSACPVWVPKPQVPRPEGGAERQASLPGSTRACCRSDDAHRRPQHLAADRSPGFRAPSRARTAVGRPRLLAATVARNSLLATVSSTSLLHRRTVGHIKTTLTVADFPAAAARRGRADAKLRSARVKESLALCSPPRRSLGAGRTLCRPFRPRPHGGPLVDVPARRASMGPRKGTGGQHLPSDPTSRPCPDSPPRLN